MSSSKTSIHQLGPRRWIIILVLSTIMFFLLWMTIIIIPTILKIKSGQDFYLDYNVEFMPKYIAALGIINILLNLYLGILEFTKKGRYLRDTLYCGLITITVWIGWLTLIAAVNYLGPCAYRGSSMDPNHLSCETSNKTLFQFN